MFIVTGANGFIGSAMVRELNQRGHSDIICVDTVSLGERPEPLKKAKYSKFLSADQFYEWCLDSKSNLVDCIFHMGAISTTTETDWAKLVTHNIEFSKKIFSFATDNKIPLIYASSAAVYGDGSLGFSDTKDSALYAPLNLYGKSKRDFDCWAQAQIATPPQWVGLRFFNVYGPNEYHKNDMASVVYKAFLQIKSSGKLKLFKSHKSDYQDGRQLRDFIYVKDVTRWMFEIYKNKNLKNGIYNMGFGKAREWLDLAQATFKSMGKTTQIEWVDIPENIRNQYQYFTEADMTNAFALGLSKPEYSLESGVTDYLKNYLLTDEPFL
jgi:ADP-L-glycero-D-manno-heptose 6-epimerase